MAKFDSPYKRIDKPIFCECRLPCYNCSKFILDNPTRFQHSFTAVKNLKKYRKDVKEAATKRGEAVVSVKRN